MANDIDLEKAYVSIVTRDNNAVVDIARLEKAYVSLVTQNATVAAAAINISNIEKAYVSIVTRITNAPDEGSFVGKMYATAFYREGTDIPTLPVIVIY